MKYCSTCGQQVEQKIPAGDNRYRYVCVGCETIHYQNPRIIAGTVPVWDGKILLCRRAIEPRYGYWTLPAGFMENAETTIEAAARETLEEALANVTIDGLYSIIDVPHINQVHMFYRATLVDGSFGAGEESLETRLFAANEIPWDEISFPTVKRTLEFFLSEMPSGKFGLHVTDIRPPSTKRVDQNASSRNTS
ncbi:MAG: NUDIX hydrolase [Gammaproteobacteria bacterium]|uniref:Bifunctional nicotinamide mononucleotide adenylyltransferase/ADP-ribose pyrophosphatase n=1 Tax=Marinobacter litoralis TaxID=187981 RepID=A0A3M2REP4_9GAMM|nr:NUDIX hydrolase [Marinobacter litoralis]MBR9870700.1 NUDIX hydrolase [Gammaproteobacteria bacterium]RMJ03786.1 bifunctional nicotinamide mononucleotide adenylyltransferase/ADP-ribose pyrophosphatase [Marinobacter litoralis]